MKRHLLLYTWLLTVPLIAQTTGKILVLSNVSGQVLVDGATIGDAEPNKPLIKEVAIGDHLVQLAYTSNGKADVKNEIVTIEAEKQKAIQFNVELQSLKGSTNGSASDTVKVAELNFAIPGSLTVAAWQNQHKGEVCAYPTFYYAFEKGDVAVIDVTMSNAKGTNVIDVSTYPGNVSKFSNRSFSQLSGQTFKVDERCILRIQLATNHTFDRNGFMRIRRIPASPTTADFSTDVMWRQVTDTTYSNHDEPYVISSDTSIVSPVDQIAKVSSQHASNGNPNHTIVDFTLPAGTVAWSYYIGVGKEGDAAFGAAREQLIANVSKPLMAMVGSNPLGLLAIGGANDFSKIQGADNVKYWFISDWQNVQQFEEGQTFMQYKQGDVVNDASRMMSPLAGKVFLALLNDNLMEPIDVTVKVSAVVVRFQTGIHSVRTPLIQTHKEAYTSND